MSINRLSDLVIMMAACDKRCTYDLDFRWPLHAALAEAANRESLCDGWPAYEIGLVDHSGAGVPALDAAVLEACSEGWFESDADRSRCLVLSAVGAVAAGRQMMTLQPEVAACVYRAALFWATNASTLSKNLDAALWSDAAMYSHRPPKRLQPVPVSQ